MSALRVIVLGFLFIIVNVSAANLRDRNIKPYRMVCYYGSWSGNRHGDGYISPDDLDPRACTHLIYSFAGFNKNQIEPRDKYLDLQENWGKGFYKKFNNLRKKNPGLTTLITVGEWRHGFKLENIRFSKMISDLNQRNTFISSSVEFLKKYDFDGLDIVWEFHGTADDKNKDRNNFVSLLKELKKAFEPYGFLLTLGVASVKNVIEASYDIPEISKYADIINVMAYDFHGPWESRTAHHSPLYARPDESLDDSHKNIDHAIQQWINSGADKTKITLGIPLYARCYRLNDKRRTGFGDYAPNSGTPGPFTQNPGIMGYNELCLKQKKETWTTVRNNFHHAPYTYLDDQWCSYDDATSVTTKVQYAKAKGLSGAMVWSLDTDDFKGLCFDKKFPILSSIVDALKDNSVSQNPTTPKWTPGSTTEPDTEFKPSTENPLLAGICKEEGLMKMPNDCSKYIQCVPEDNGFRAVEQLCPPGTVFSEAHSRCDYSVNVPECN